MAHFCSHKISLIVAELMKDEPIELYIPFYGMYRRLANSIFTQAHFKHILVPRFVLDFNLLVGHA